MDCRILFLLLLPPALHATILLDTLILGGNDITSSLIPDTIFPMLVNLTNATSMTPSGENVDAILGKTARWYFPNGTFYSFSLVYITRVRFTIHTPDDNAALAKLECCLNQPINDHRAIALDKVSIEVAPSAWTDLSSLSWPWWTGVVFIVVWVLTLGVCVCCLCFGHPPPPEPPKPPKGVRISIPKTGIRSAAAPQRPHPRGISITLPMRDIRR